MEEKSFGSVIVSALIHFFYSIVYFFFITPFALWKKAAIRLAEARENKSLSISNINGLWPFFSFLKAFFFEFLFDGLTFIAYFLGVLFAIVALVEGAGEAFLGSLFGAYFCPIFIAIMRDGCQLFIILPIRKLISFFVKPAQQLDLNVTKKN